jgi:hypothetical protein
MMERTMSAHILSDALRAQFEGAPSVYASAVSPNAVPLTTRVLAAWPSPSTDHITIAVSAPSSGAFLEALRPGARVAAVVVQVATYLTYQFKGSVHAVRTPDAAECAAVDAFIARFAALVAHVGIDPVRYPQTYTAPPVVCVDIAVEAVFDQTPRVGAGGLVRAAEVRA